MTELAGNEELQHVIDRSNLELIFTDYNSGQWDGKMFQDILDWHTHEVEKRIAASNQQLLRELEGQKQENRNARIEELEWAEHNADDVNFSIRERIDKLRNED